MGISKKTIEDVRFGNDIVEVIGSYLNLKRAGSNFKGLCPFHKEKTPSFHVNPQRQIFHCFGCGAGGDVFKFLMMHDGVDFNAAIRMLAKKAGIHLAFDDQAEQAEHGEKEILYEILSGAGHFFRGTLKSAGASSPAAQYLAKRGLDGEIAEKFMIGYAPEGWDAILRWGQQKKFSPAAMEKAGMLIRKPDGDFYDRFRNRLMFPIHDEQGRIIGFSGRSLEADSKSAKYINSPETPLFRKSRVLYALDKARRSIIEERTALICEGQIDVIRCHQAGFTTAVASQGTAFTEDHIAIIRRYADSALLVFDSDKAGKEAAIKTGTLFMTAGLSVRVATLPPGEDPDSFIRGNGPDAFRKMLENSSSIIAYQATVLCEKENIKTEVGAMRVARALLSTIATSPNAVQKAALVQEAALKLHIPASALMDELRRIRNRVTRQSDGTEKQPGKPAPRPQAEISLCEHIVHVVDEPELANLIREYLPLNLVTDKTCRQLVKAAMLAFEKGSDIIDMIREQEHDDPDLLSLASAVMMAPCKIARSELSRQDAVRDLILYLWKKKIEADRSELARKLDETGDKNTEIRLRQMTYDLKNLRKWDTGADVIQLEMS